MKLVTFQPAGGPPRLGAVVKGGVLDLSAAARGRLPASMLAFLEAGPGAWDAARGLAAAPSAADVSPLAAVRLLAPLPNPPALRDFFAFEGHAAAGARRRGETLPPEWYQLPAYYKGNHRQVFGPEDDIPWPSYTRRLDFECEIACVVGMPGQDLSVEEAARHVFGYMLFNDFSARDIQKKEMVLRMGPAKGKDFANAFGPWLVTADEVDPKRDFELAVRVNGEEWSRGRFAEQHWGFPLMLSHVSQGERVYPGDLLGSGTFHKGCGLDLDRWIKPGDVVELEVPALGTLRNRVGVPKAPRELNYEKEGAR
ncbi:MAG: fumarylacetoacetate hydrolase family protein [Elusimicrobia bacterium]|nr:fumarylacetoacetate hydrolase family protein [Elusimicrobiota bacterium]